MAQRKRTRDEDDVDGDTEVEIESASSSFRQNLNNKRTKVALAQARGGSVVSDDDDDYRVGDANYDDLLNDHDGYDIHGGQDGDHSPVDPGMDYSLHMGDDEESEADSPVNEIVATQIVEKQMQELRDNIASDEGIIEEIQARNFMCHSNLRIRLGPLINFIIGHNGSGKSAVLTALTMCLGGKANQTNRGANLKSMIKTGQETATLAVKIKNQGEYAYKADMYGSSITVERHFSRSGTSGFKIKNSQNKTVTTKRADLDDILDYFSLQLDNPINVLTQDLARSFLSNSSASDKYKFFMKGTQLETLDADYRLFEIQLDNMNEKLRLREGDIELLAQKERQALLRKERANKIEAIEQKKRDIQRMHAWLQVRNQEDILDEYQNEVEAAQATVEAKAAEAESIVAAFDAQDAAVEAAKRRVEEFQTYIGPAKEKRDAGKAKFDKNKDELLKVTTEERGIHDSLKSNKKEQKRLETEINLERERLSGVHGDAHTKRLEELDELQQISDAAKQELQQHNESLPDLEQKSRTAYKDSQDAKAAQERARDAALNAGGRLQELQREEGQWYTPYHPNMQRLVAAINRETRWRAKPVGPMGTKVFLKKPEWGSIIEKTFGAALDAFAVTCRDDQEFLSNIAKREGVHNLSIFIGDPTPIDTTGKEPEEGVDTILRVLRIDDDLVRNTLIINQAIDQIVLIENSRQARDYLFADARPVNVKATIGFGNIAGSGTRYDRSRGGSERSSPVLPWKGKARMRTNRDEQLAHLRRLVDDAKDNLAQAEQRTRNLQNELKIANQAVEGHKRQQRGLRTKMQQDEDAVDAKQAEIDNNRPQDGRLQELERQLQSIKSDLQNAKDQYQDSVQAKQTLGDLGVELKALLDTEQAALDQVNERVEGAETRLKEAQDRRHEALLEKNEAIDNVDTAKSTVAGLEEKRDTQKALVEEYTEQATQVCQRVRIEEGVTIQVLDDRLERFKREQAEAARRAGGSREELTAQHKDAHDDWTKAKNERDSLVRVAKNLQATLKHRHFRWQEFRRYISMRARVYFQYLLSERNFRGRVLLDHRGKTLDIAVEPDKTKSSDAGRQAKTLSGGEKSFSTICLLLSIWEAMGSPIRCLDEFDVFMDSVNRAQSMGMMIQTARRAVGRQFILITPQSMNSVQLGDDVKIHKMSDPERGIAAHFNS